jgi:hypothetical protein
MGWFSCRPGFARCHPATTGKLGTTGSSSASIGCAADRVKTARITVVDEVPPSFPQQYPCSRRHFPNDGSQFRPPRPTKTALIDFSRPTWFLRELRPRRTPVLRSNPRVRSLYGFPPTSLICHEKDIPTKGSPQKATPRFPPSHAHPRRAGDDQESSPKRPEATRCLAINRSVTLETFVESCLTGSVAARAASSWSARRAQMGPLDSGSWYRGVAVQP